MDTRCRNMIANAAARGRGRVDFWTGHVYRGGEAGLDRIKHVAHSLAAMLKIESAPDRLVLRNRITPWGLSFQPSQQFAPSLVSTSPGVGPVQGRYGDVEVMAIYTALNVNLTNWPTVAICTDADRLVAIFAGPVPRFSEQDLRDVHVAAWARMLEIVALAPHGAKL